MNLRLKKTSLIATIVLLVGGVGYATWKHFNDDGTAGNLQKYTPLNFGLMEVKSCELPKPGFLDLSFYEPRYFVLAREKEWETLHEQLGYSYIRFGGNDFDKIIDYGKEIIVGVLYPFRPRHDTLVRPLIGAVSRNGNSIMVGLRVTPKSYFGSAPSGEGLDPLFTPCRYQLAKINVNDLASGKNAFHFVDEGGRILKTEELFK